MPNIDFRYLLPEIILAVFGALVLIVGLWTGKREEYHGFWDNFTPELLAGAGLLMAGIMVFGMAFGVPRLELEPWPPAFGDGLMAKGHYAVDQAALFFKLIAIGTGLLCVWMSTLYLKIKRVVRGEYYSFLIFATLAACLVASANELILLWLTLEFLSIVSYVLVGYLRADPRSSEASVKYFLFGAASGAIMLFGLSILYGICGTTNLGMIRELTAAGIGPRSALLFSLILIMAGIGFKISMVPFHLWAPDAYQGAPTPITAFLSVASKAAGFIALIRVFVWAVPIPPGGGYTANWIPILTLLSVLSMTYGNLAAIWQKNLKRMLAYSGIAHCGYILIGVIAAASPRGEPLLGFDVSPLASVVIYIAAYAVTNLGVFAALVAIRNRIGSYNLDDYDGLAPRNLGAAAALALLLLSLAGIPPTIGFIGKFFLLLSAIECHLYLLAFFAIGNTAVSIYYYYNVCRHMFLVKGKETSPIPIGYVTSLVGAAVLLCTLATLAFCIFPMPLIDLGRQLAQLLPAL
jgi:NADH-quinone oxidoreductase subunit N